MLKILLVDDEKIAIEGLIALLDWKRFEGELIGTAASGEEALALMEESHPDLIISDIEMGLGMNGIDLARAVYQKEEGIQMILLTAYEKFEYAKQAIRYGVSDYVLKPITSEKLEQLNELLCQKNEELLLKRKSYLTAWNDDLKQKILEALRTQNHNTLDEFFQSELFEELMAGGDNELIGIQLINYLYLYLQEINVNPGTLAASKRRAIEEFLDTTVKQDRMNLIMTMYYDLLTSMSSKASPHTDTISAYALRYIGEHFSDPEFNLSALSYAMHVSLSHLSTVFKQTTGSNLSAYVTDLRLEKAQKLLADMQYSIADVAVMSGYSDSKYFAKQFKKKTNFTPSEYRNFVIQGGFHGN